MTVHAHTFILRISIFSNVYWCFIKLNLYTKYMLISPLCCLALFDAIMHSKFKVVATFHLKITINFCNHATQIQNISHARRDSTNTMIKKLTVFACIFFSLLFFGKSAIISDWMYWIVAGKFSHRQCNRMNLWASLDIYKCIFKPVH